MSHTRPANCQQWRCPACSGVLSWQKRVATCRRCGVCFAVRRSGNANQSELWNANGTPSTTDDATQRFMLLEMT